MFCNPCANIFRTGNRQQRRAPLEFVSVVLQSASARRPTANCRPDHSQTYFVNPLRPRELMLKASFSLWFPRGERRTLLFFPYQTSWAPPNEKKCSSPKGEATNKKKNARRQRAKPQTRKKTFVAKGRSHEQEKKCSSPKGEDMNQEKNARRQRAKTWTRKS